MHDAALDREIAGLLDVAPSPEFLARVRARVAEEPEPGTWRASWMFTAAGAMAVIVVVVMMWPSSEPEIEQLKPAVLAQHQQPAVVAPTETTPRPAGVTPTTVSPRRAATSRAIEAHADAREIELPEVVIGENEVRAYTAWVASIRDRRFNVAVPVAPNPDTPLDVEVLPPAEPLEIEPILQVATLQSEGERP